MPERMLVEWKESTIDGRTTSSVSVRAATGDIVGARVAPLGDGYGVEIVVGGMSLDGLDPYPSLAAAQAKGDSAIFPILGLATDLVRAGLGSDAFLAAVSEAAKAALARRGTYQKHLDRNPGAPPNPAGGIVFPPRG